MGKYSTGVRYLIWIGLSVVLFAVLCAFDVFLWHREIHWVFNSIWSGVLLLLDIFVFDKQEVKKYQEKQKKQNKE